MIQIIDLEGIENVPGLKLLKDGLNLQYEKSHIILLYNILLESQKQIELLEEIRDLLQEDQ